MRPFLHFAPTALFGLLVACVPHAAVAQTITVAWRDKPPYHYTENGIDKGFLLERARQIFANAGLNANFVKEPPKRIWANFQNGLNAYCSIGWYRLPEREAIAQFSAPFHIDPPHTLLASPDMVAQVRAHATVESLLADKNLILGVVDGVSYGAQLDALINASANQVLRRTVDPAAMVRMTAANRVSFMFIDRDDLGYLRERDGTLGNVVRIDFPDMPPGLQRYILCSKDVPASTMARINRVIASMKGIGNEPAELKRPSKRRGDQ